MEKSASTKHSLLVAGRKTSVSLEKPFWQGLREIAAAREWTLSKLVTEIGSNRQYSNLSSTLRLFVLDYYRAQNVAANSPPVPSPPSAQDVGTSSVAGG